MSGIHLSLSSFHKRVINLNLLQLFHFIKKELRINSSFIIYKKTSNRLFNILKSPVQYKIARNQLVLKRIKVFTFIGLTLKSLVKRKVRSFISTIFLIFISNFINKRVVTSNSVWKIRKIFRV